MRQKKNFIWKLTTASHQQNRLTCQYPFESLFLPHSGRGSQQLLLSRTDYCDALSQGITSPLNYNDFFLWNLLSTLILKSLRFTKIQWKESFGPDIISNKISDSPIIFHFYDSPNFFYDPNPKYDKKNQIYRNYWNNSGYVHSPDGSTFQLGIPIWICIQLGIRTSVWYSTWNCNLNGDNFGRVYEKTRW